VLAAGLLLREGCRWEEQSSQKKNPFHGFSEIDEFANRTPPGKPETTGFSDFVSRKDVFCGNPPAGFQFAASFGEWKMSVFKNKHVLTASLVAPLLAVMSYYAIDFFVGEKPHAAEDGQSYQLVEKPNCRYESGSCGLKNGDFELLLVPEWVDPVQLQLTLRSEYPLEGVVIAVDDEKSGTPLPTDMLPVGEDGLVWTAVLSSADPAQDRLRLVASASQSLWYGDVALKFAMADTGQ